MKSEERGRGASGSLRRTLPAESPASGLGSREACCGGGVKGRAHSRRSIRGGGAVGSRNPSIPHSRVLENQNMKTTDAQHPRPPTPLLSGLEGPLDVSDLT